MIRLIAIVSSIVLVAGCAPAVIDGGCTEFVPITYSAAQDSEATKAQIRGHNAVWVKLCGK